MNTNDFELENMRQQLNTLKQKLEKQEIVNERMIRHSMKKNVSHINSRNIALSVLSLLMIPYCYWIFYMQLHFSLSFWVFTALFNVAAIVYTYYNTKDILNKHLMEEDLLEVRRKLARAKKLDSQWLLVGIPFIFIWLGWFAYEIYVKSGFDEVTAFFWAGCVGAIIGGSLGYRIHTKTQHQYQDVIDQIEDLTNE